MTMGMVRHPHPVENNRDLHAKEGSSFQACNLPNRDAAGNSRHCQLAILHLIPL